MDMDMHNCTDNDMMKMNHTMDMDTMKMYFHTGYESHILIENWTAKTDAAVFGWCAFFFFLAIGYELLKYYRQLHLLRAQTRTVSVTEENGTTSSSTATQESQGDSHISAGDKYDGPLHRRSVTEKREIKMLSIVHVVQTALHVIQIFVSYVLMLAFMLFNVWICLAVVLGAGVGYFLVGSRKHTTYSALDEDHCH